MVSINFFSATVDAPFGSSDHWLVSFNVIREPRPTFDLKNANWINLSAYLSCIRLDF